MAKKNPSTRWFFKDWRNDMAVQSCSLAARGAWMEMLGICAENGGYLLSEGKGPSIAALARYVGSTPAAMGRILKELEEHGVFSRTEEGIIYNRRMVRGNGANGDHETGKSTQQEQASDQADLFDDGLSRARGHATDSQDSPPPLSTPKPPPPPETVKAPEGEKNQEMNPSSTATRCLGGSADAPPPLDRRGSSAVERRAEDPGGGGSIPSLGAVLARYCSRTAGPPRQRRKKTPALRAQIKEQLRQKHQRFLAATAPNEIGAYWAAMLDDDPAVAQRVFDAVDQRMRAARWDDMRQWKQREGIAA